MVVQKSDLKTWTNARGSGKLFNVTLMDDTVSIKIIELACQLLIKNLLQQFETQ